MDQQFPTILQQWLDEKRNSDLEGFDRTTKNAAIIAGASQRASAIAQESEPLTRKERTKFNSVVRPIEEKALEQWAKANKLWITPAEFLEQYGSRFIGAGAEQKVYLHESARKVIKVNTGNYHGNWLEFFNRLLCHSILFPSTSYKIIGFSDPEDCFAVILEQPFIVLDLGATRNEVELYLNQNGFLRTKNDDYYNAQ
jgi:Serine/Threonine/Tyrosine Kinase found in polyvalent proteins